MEWKNTTHRLSYPISAGDQVIQTVTLRAPNVEALEQIEELGLEEGKRLTVKQMRAIIVALSDLTMEQAGKLHQSDLKTLGGAAVPLLEEEEAA